jgi:hypothetical protein
VQRWAGIALGLVVLVGCSDGSSKATPKPDRVPIPRVSLPPGLSLDENAWVREWRTTPVLPDDAASTSGIVMR